MKKYRLLIVILLLAVLFITSYLIFGDDIKGGLFILVLRMKPSIFREKLARFITNNAGTIFFKPLLKLSRSSNPGFSKTACDVLKCYVKSTSSQNINELINALSTGKKETKILAAEMLGKFRVPQGVEPLIKALDDKDYDVRRAAITSLGIMGDIRAVPPLIKLLKDKNPDVRNYAAFALGEIQDYSSIDSLIDLMSDEEESVRLSASAALGNFQGDKLGNRLIVLVENDHGEHRELAIYVLKDMKYKKAAPSLVKILENEKNGDVLLYAASEALIALDDKTAVDAMRRGLNYQYEEVRRSCARGLGKLKDKKACDSLILALKDKDFMVRSNAALSLGELGDKKAVNPLLKQLKDNNPNVRADVIMALGKFKDKRALEPLLKIASQDPLKMTIRENISLADVLGDYGDKRCIKFLTGNLKNPDALVRNAAIVALGKLKDPATIPHLKKIPSMIEREAQKYADEEEKRRGGLSKGDKEIYAKYYRDINREVISSSEAAIRKIREDQGRSGEGVEVINCE